MIVPSAAAEFDSDAFGEDVEDHAIVVIESPKLAQIEEQGVLVTGRTEGLIDLRQPIKRFEEGFFSAGQCAPSIQDFGLPTQLRRL